MLPSSGSALNSNAYLQVQQPAAQSRPHKTGPEQAPYRHPTAPGLAHLHCAQASKGRCASGYKPLEACNKHSSWCRGWGSRNLVPPCTAGAASPRCQSSSLTSCCGACSSCCAFVGLNAAGHVCPARTQTAMACIQCASDSLGPRIHLCPKRSSQWSLAAAVKAGPTLQLAEGTARYRQRGPRLRHPQEQRGAEPPAGAGPAAPQPA